LATKVIAVPFQMMLVTLISSVADNPASPKVALGSTVNMTVCGLDVLLPSTTASKAGEDHVADMAP